MTALLELSHICRNYPSGGGTVAVLKGISMSINAGEMVAIVGASGSGKSTLMNILGCLDEPTSGTYRVSGIDVSTLSSDARAKLRREHFGFIFQRYHLLSHLTAIQNVEVPAVYAGVERQKRHNRAQTLLAQLGLNGRIDYRPSQLSGGQQQRVSIARALMNGGQVILADEPTGALDRHSSEEVMEILHHLRSQGHTVIIVTHDPQIAAQAERIIEICDGEIISNPPATSRPQAALQKKKTLSSSNWRQLYSGFREALTMAWLAMTANKIRTLLTMLGIIIGIASVVSIVVVGEAAKRVVLADIRAIGTNTINVYPGKDFGDDAPQSQQALKYSDLAAILQRPWINSATPALAQNLRLRYGNHDIAATANGVSSDYFNVYGMAFSEGNTFNQEQLNSRAQVVVIDNNTRRQLFPYQTSVVGKIILVGNMPATIIGVAKEKLSMSGGSKQNLRVWLPYTTISGRIMGQTWLNSITVRIKDGYDSTLAEQQLEHLLTLRHGKKDIFTWNMNSILKTAEKTTYTLQLFLTLVAVISLVVGGIGVMNIMLVSVAERTREIGIRMAVGAKPSDVLQQFLIEAVLVCLVGGILGIILSIVIAFPLQLFLPSWTIGFSPVALLTAFLCSTFTGILFGWLPARNAAKLDPVDALARE